MGPSEGEHGSLPDTSGLRTGRAWQQWPGGGAWAASCPVLGFAGGSPLGSPQLTLGAMPREAMAPKLVCPVSNAASWLIWLQRAPAPSHASKHAPCKPPGPRGGPPPPKNCAPLQLCLLSIFFQQPQTLPAAPMGAPCWFKGMWWEGHVGPWPWWWGPSVMFLSIRKAAEMPGWGSWDPWAPRWHLGCAEAFCGAAASPRSANLAAKRAGCEHRCKTTAKRLVG